MLSIERLQPCISWKELNVWFYTKHVGNEWVQAHENSSRFMRSFLRYLSDNGFSDPVVALDIFAFWEERVGLVHNCMLRPSKKRKEGNIKFWVSAKYLGGFMPKYPSGLEYLHHHLFLTCWHDLAYFVSSSNVSNVQNFELFDLYKHGDNVWFNCVVDFGIDVSNWDLAIFGRLSRWGTNLVFRIHFFACLSCAGVS